jgi:hypothetical protein
LRASHPVKGGAILVAVQDGETAFAKGRKTPHKKSQQENKKTPKGAFFM